MTKQKNRISPAQLALSVTCFIQGSVLLTEFLLKITAQDTWIAVVLGYFIAAGMIWIYCRILSYFPGKTVIEILELTAGRIAGKIAGGLLIFYFLTIAALNVRDAINFIVVFLLPETPMMLILVLFLILCTFAVSSGIEAIARLSIFLIVITIFVVLTQLVLNLAEMRFENFKPALMLPGLKYVQSTHNVSGIIFGEVFVFSMIVPCVQDERKAHRSMQAGLFFGALTLLIVVIRDIGVLGRVAEIVSMPSYESIRLINVSNIFTRLEVLFAISLIIKQFFKVSVLFYASSVGISQIFKLSDIRPMLYVIALFIGVYAYYSFDSAIENAFWGSNTGVFFSSIFVIVLPLLLLCGILIRKKFFRPGRVPA